jgi:hypothetical protein
MTRMWQRSRFWVPTGALFLAILTAMLTPYPAGAAARSSNHVPKTFWKAYPLDPSPGNARTEQRPAGAGDTSSPSKDEVAPATTAARDDAAHFAPQQSAGDDRLRLIAITLGAAFALLAMILVTRSASEALRDIARALPLDTIVLAASVIFVSVLAGIGVVLLISPMLGP